MRYVLEGSVQRASGRVRITAQLIDAATGRHLWAESYDRELKDLFALQDEITRQVVTELQVKLGLGEAARYIFHSTENPEAFALYLRARIQMERFEKELNLRAQELALKAIELDPEFAKAITFLGWTHQLEARHGWVEDPARSFRQAEELARRAVVLNENDAYVYLLWSRVHTRKGLHERGHCHVNCSDSSRCFGVESQDVTDLFQAPSIST